MHQTTESTTTGTRDRRSGGGRRRGLTTPRARLTTPMVRDDGALRPATWDEAMTRVADGFASVLDSHGPEAVGLFSCSKATNEVNYAVQKFGRTVLGTNNIDSCNRT